MTQAAVLMLRDPPAFTRLLMAARSGPVEHASSAQADAADVHDCRAGDQDAFRRLIERHQARIAALMWHFTRDREAHAELVQDVFVEAWRALASYRGEAPFEHWLARIATRTGYRFWRRREGERRVASVPLEDCPELRAPEELEPSRAAELLQRLLGELPPRDRLVLTLRYLQERSVRETAELTGWSPTMVKVQAWRARGKLLRRFEQATREAEDE